MLDASPWRLFGAGESGGRFCADGKHWCIAGGFNETIGKMSRVGLCSDQAPPGKAGMGPTGFLPTLASPPWQARVGHPATRAFARKVRCAGRESPIERTTENKGFGVISGKKKTA